MLIRKTEGFEIVRELNFNKGILFDDACVHIEEVVQNYTMFDTDYKRNELIKLLLDSTSSKNEFKKNLNLNESQYERLMELFTEIGIYG